MKKSDEEKFIEWLKPDQKKYTVFIVEDKFPKQKNANYDLVAEYKQNNHKVTLGIITCLIGIHHFFETNGWGSTQKCVNCSKIRE